MDFSESTKIVYNRIQTLEPENVSKIIGYLLLQDHGEREMIRLAFSPDNLIQSLINKAKLNLGLSAKLAASGHFLPPEVNPEPVPDALLQLTPSAVSPHNFPSHSSIGAGNSFWDPQSSPNQQRLHNLRFVPPAYIDEYRLRNQLHFLSLEDNLDSANVVGSDFHDNFFHQDPTLAPRASRRSPSLPEFPVKLCHYFSKGFCKHGSNCRYFHGHPVLGSLSQIFSPTLNDGVNDDYVFSRGSLEKLEIELRELLKSRRGFPVSIAALPMLYYEKFGKTLQAEGYLTESQRHGKAGFSLTKLLARLRNSIRVIDRPHGQHSVILAEDIPKYLDCSGERNEHGAIVAGSRQIYLTFPAESTFTELDVFNYFNNYGPVQDVRIPCQQKRMFGFVTFVFAETVKQILAKGNPHFVCGARVLVKPYREKSRLADRKFVEKTPRPVFDGSHFLDAEPELHTMTRAFHHSVLLKKQLAEEHEQAMELERRHMSGLQLAAKPLNHPTRFGYSVGELKPTEDCAEQVEFPSSDRFSYLLNVVNDSSTSEDNLMHIKTKCTDQESSQGLKLPDSPFASTVATGISTVI